MNIELDRLRAKFGRFLVVLLWLHVPVLGVAAWMTGHSIIGTMAAAAFLASAYHLTWHHKGTAPATRYLSAVALVGEPALLLYVLSGHAWQMDMHMYFFAMLALTIAWFDRRVLLLAATVTALHHLLLLYLLPYAVFPGEGNLARVLLHAVIVAFQTAVLVWLSDMLIETFERIGRMSEEIVAKNTALEERTKEAEEASSAKSIFLANMSHEIRTPMNAILGFCLLAQRTELSPKQLNYITKIHGAGVSLLRLINDILDFSKNEAGKLALESHCFELRATISSQSQMVLDDAKAKGVAIETCIDDAIPQVLLGDELRFSQVVLNLLSNAVKFTAAGSVTITARLLALDVQRATVQVSVRDTGIGMTEEQRETLFLSFSQADSSMSRRFGGTGLGLAICKQIVELMGGKIEVQSEAGVGSTFTFAVAFAVPSVDVKAIEPSEAVANLRILACDDNPAARQIIGEIFESWAMPIDLVASGPEVIAALEDAVSAGNPYDLLLIDWKMPGMDGVETIRSLRANPNLPQLPVTLMVSAYGFEEFMALKCESNIAAFINKPVEPRALLNTLTELFPEPQVLSPTPVVEHSPHMVSARLQGLSVLLVEDNDINQEIAVELLKDAGLNVEIAVNGKVACDKVEAHGADYAAILMDVQMPEMDGIEATKIIRKQWTADTIPIIAMTAHAYDAERQRCLDAGMNDHISKPVDPLALVRTLERWLKPHPAKASAASDDVSMQPVSALPVELPPFGLNAALKRVNGKSALLRKLIITFGENFSDTGQELARLIASQKFVEARRLAHTLKGVAGSLELLELQQIAADIERLIAASELDDVPSRVEALSRAIAPAIAASQMLRSIQDHNVQASSPEPAACKDITAATALLREHIQRRSLGARSSFEGLANALALPIDTRHSHPIRKALDRLDYDAALGLLDEIDSDPEHSPCIQDEVA